MFKVCHTQLIIHSMVCLVTGSYALPKGDLHRMRFCATSFNFEYPLVYVRSSSSFLRLFHPIPVTCKRYVPLKCKLLTHINNVTGFESLPAPSLFHIGLKIKHAYVLRTALLLCPVSTASNETLRKVQVLLGTSVLICPEESLSSIRTKLFFYSQAPFNIDKEHVQGFQKASHCEGPYLQGYATQ